MNEPLDISGPLFSIAKKQQLVRFVLGETSAEESHWLEWKSTLDLDEASGVFHIARAVLGFSNRAPDPAARACDGFAYLVVGVSPGELQGIARLDPADLPNKLEPFLGTHEAPQWSPTWVEIDERLVLIVEVAPPRPGHPIHTLRKQGAGVQAGHVFVRREGKTEQASPEDMRALTQRASGERAPGLELIVDCSTSGPLQWVSRAAVDDVTRRAVAIQAQVLLDQAKWHEERAMRNQDDDLTATVKALNLLAAMGSTPRKDPRTFQQFIDEVEKWRAEAQLAATLNIGRQLMELNPLVIRVTNSTEEPVKDVRVKLTIDADISAETEVGEIETLPRRPRAFGSPEPLLPPDLGLYGPRQFLPSELQSLYHPTDFTLANEPLAVEWDVGDLHAGETAEMEPIYLTAADQDDQLDITARWVATSGSLGGIPKGSVRLPVAHAPVDLSHLILWSDVGPEDH